jgi:DNA-binding XRE family transcriptional regulator
VAEQLRQLGDDLVLARKRRRESRKAWAGRIGVSEPTLVHMESGDPGVAIGTYATALWLMGRAPAIAELADPQQDLGALESELRAARQRSVRKPHSIERRLRAPDGDGQPDADGAGADSRVD